MLNSITTFCWYILRQFVLIMTQVVSAHTPCPFELKRIESKIGNNKNGDGSFSLAMGGISASLQFSLPLMWTASKREGISLFEMHRLISFNPATLAGLEHRKVLNYFNF